MTIFPDKATTLLGCIGVPKGSHNFPLRVQEPNLRPARLKRVDRDKISLA